MDLNLFFATWYELLAYFAGFSDDLYNENLYLHIGLYMVFIPVAVLTLYYYAVNSVTFNKWWHWLILVIILALINFGLAYRITYIELSYLYEQQNSELPYSSEFVSFALINLIWTIVVSIVWSFLIKWGSKNCKRTPF